MAGCLNSFTRRFYDLAGKERYSKCSCGRCINCLHNIQDSWSIRLQEELKSSGSFVYDTLTFSNASLPVVDFSSDYMKGDFSDDTKKLIDKYYSRCDPLTGEFSVWLPCVTREVISNWIKRGRELYRKANYGMSLKLKYFICMEFGPKSSRPHFHCLFFGISQRDYVTYFAKPWRRDMGFTKTKYFDRGFKSDKDLECISRYVSKYVSKGVFDSPFVKDGLLPKPFRSISNGIGEAYVLQSVFDWFRRPVVEVLRDITIRTDIPAGMSVERESHVRYCLTDNGRGDMLEGLKLPSDNVISRLVTYYDRQGYPHACPRYFREKLLNSHKPNLIHYALQNAILEHARLFFNKGIQRLAVSLGFGRRIRGGAEGSTAGLGARLYNLLCDEDAIRKRVQALSEASRRYIKLKNHYGRAMNFAPLWC